jgi:hypothetical protein
MINCRTLSQFSLAINYKTSGFETKYKGCAHVCKNVMSVEGIAKWVYSLVYWSHMVTELTKLPVFVSPRAGMGTDNFIWW